MNTNISQENQQQQLEQDQTNNLAQQIQTQNLDLQENGDIKEDLKEEEVPVVPYRPKYGRGKIEKTTDKHIPLLKIIKTEENQPQRKRFYTDILVLENSKWIHMDFDYNVMITRPNHRYKSTFTDSKHHFQNEGEQQFNLITYDLKKYRQMRLYKVNVLDPYEIQESLKKVGSGKTSHQYQEIRVLDDYKQQALPGMSKVISVDDFVIIYYKEGKDFFKTIQIDMKTGQQRDFFNDFNLEQEGNFDMITLCNKKQRKMVYLRDGGLYFYNNFKKQLRQNTPIEESSGLKTDVQYERSFKLQKLTYKQFIVLSPNAYHEVFAKSSNSKRDHLVKLKTYRFQSTFMMAIGSGPNKKYAISIEQDSRAINITKEYIFHLRVMDMKRKIVCKQELSCFRGQALYGIFQAKNLDVTLQRYDGFQNKNFNGFLVCYRRNQGVFLMVYDLDNMTSFQYILDIDGTKVLDVYQLNQYLIFTLKAQQKLMFDISTQIDYFTQ
eukprot:403362196